MSNRYINACVKTLITLVCLHIIFLIGGFLFGKQIGFLNLPMIWTHLESGIGILISLVLSVALYCSIFTFCTDDTK